MRTIMIAAALFAVAACTTQKAAPADSLVVVQTPPIDSTVQHVIPPDTLVRGDGKKCVVNPISKSDTATVIGHVFICNWR